MPAIDNCEPQVINALQKVGWIVTQQPFAIRINPKELVYADLHLSHNQLDYAIIVVEVKCFSDNRSHLDQFYHAVGQYLIYRQILNLKPMKVDLYLSVPSTIYQTFFKRISVQAVIDEIAMKMVIIDLEREEVIEWIP